MRGTYDPESCPVCGRECAPIVSEDRMTLSYWCACRNDWWRRVYARSPITDLRSSGAYIETLGQEGEVFLQVLQVHGSVRAKIRELFNA